MKNSITYMAWFSLAVALCLWGIVLYLALSIQQQATDSASSAAQSTQQLDRLAYTQRLTALAADTKEERAKLESLVQPDVVSIVNTIESAGKGAHITATVSDALPEGPPQTLPGGQPLQAVAFVVRAEGTFVGLMRLTMLFEHLPLFSSVEQVEFENISGANPAAPWRFTARIKVMTTSLSS